MGVVYVPGAIQEKLEPRTEDRRPLPHGENFFRKFFYCNTKVAELGESENFHVATVSDL